jgi:Domain of unknown function (DUF4349)
MQTDIGFLEELREDLVEAAWRETMAGRGRRPKRVVNLPRSRGVVIALVAALVLVTAGATGIVAMRLGGGTETQAISGATGATGSGDAESIVHGAPRAPFPGASASPMLSPLPASDQAAGYAPTVQALRGSILGPDTARIVKTASLSVVVPNGSFEQRFAEAADVADRYGGFVESATTRERAGTVTLRVDADRFGQAMDDLRALGEPKSQTVSGHDVTASYVDLQARLEIATARREVLLDLMSEAATIEQTLRVQNALDDVQLRIEQIQGELNLLNDQTAKATIELALREADAPVQLTQEQVRAPSVGSAWRHAVAGFFRAVFAVVVGLGYLLPIALAAAAVWGIVHLARRRRAAA